MSSALLSFLSIFYSLRDRHFLKTLPLSRQSYQYNTPKSLFKHFSFVILLFHFLMISLLLLDVGLSCFVCLVQVITDRARAVEGKFFLSFHLPPPPRPPFSIYYCPRHLRFASYRNSLLLKIQSPPPPLPAKSKV